MSVQHTKNREVIKEYYMFLYDLAVRKNYEHSFQLTDEEREYCEKLLSQQSAYHTSPNQYLSFMEDILKESARRKSITGTTHW